MALRIKHRGPDSAGEWIDSEHGLALAHRRLSILDLSPAGHQPMESANKRYVLSYNGEIYNHVELRTSIEANGPISWRGHSDTETFLAAVSEWGFEAALKRANGMFAIALWDRETHRLYLARDRMGEKPLYYGIQDGTFLFGSELKALQAHPSFSNRIDRNVLTLLLRYSYVPSPYAIFEGIRKLPAAHYLVISEGGRKISDPIAYWSLEAAVEHGQKNPFSGTTHEAIDTLHDLLLDAVGIRMASDVPLGAFLSGGYDSSTIVALMQAQSRRPVKTFSIGFHEDEYNEATHAKAVARHLGTDHTELYVSPKDAMSVIPSLPTMYDEPFSDSSQIPTYLVSKMARNHVTVSLSGDAGDELFCGYNRYALGYRIWQKLAPLPMPARTALSGLLRLTPIKPANGMSKFLPDRLRMKNLGDRLHKLADVLACSDAESFYRLLVSHATSPENWVLSAAEPPTLLNDRESWPDVEDFRQRMMYLDAKTYLSDDILVKVDRASMAASLEARVPFLDHRIVEFSQRLPMSMKIRNNDAKWILRQVLHRYVPQALMDRPKMGFGIPIDSWLRGPLREWAEALLDESRLRHEGYFDPKPIRKMWEEHITGTRQWHYALWDVLSFQAWLENLKYWPSTYME